MYKCQQCHKELRKEQVVQCEWKKKKKTLFLCPTCFKDYYEREQIKNMITNKKAEQLLDMKENDIKELAKRWTKQKSMQI